MTSPADEPGTRRFSRTRSRMVAVVGLLALIALGSALGRHSRHGQRYSGVTSAPTVGGIAAPVTFTISVDRTALTGFTYATLGCLHPGDDRSAPGKDAYRLAATKQALGRIAIAPDGTFAADGLRSSDLAGGRRTVTTSSVSGRLTTVGSVTGTITFSQRRSGRGAGSSGCGPATVSFTATRG
jgi:hypothetical protein